MQKIFIILALLLIVGITVFFFFKTRLNKVVLISEGNLEDATSIHDLSANRLLSGENVSLKEYEGQALLIVNTASKCGLTPQYESLQALHETHSSQGLTILGFPSNDFLKQEPGSGEEIVSFCQKNYGVEFDMFEKVKVKGENKHPVYQFLTDKDKNGVQDSKVVWNFQKYLLDKTGKLVAVFNPKVTVDDPEVLKKIEAVLAE